MEPQLNPQAFLTVTGRLTAMGRQPDGDSVHFVPDNAATLLRVPHASRLRPAQDGGVQLRIDGIDAPETHFLGQAQPGGVAARTAFLRLAGFSDVTFDEHGTVAASTPDAVPATIFVSLLDPYGRPVSYLLPGVSAEHPDGGVMQLDDALLLQTVNLQMLAGGMAYVTVYSSTPPAHRQLLFAQAQKAFDQHVGVWATDTTHQFTLADHASIGPQSGTLILPKLFRRATSYLDALTAGYSGPFPDWLASTITAPYHSDDDLVVRADGSAVRLHTLLQQSGQVVTCDLNLLQDVFIEQ
jgi:endonuclease YncB( thermonuclease family)